MRSLNSSFSQSLRLQLESNEVHLWFAWSNCIPAAIENYRYFLSEDEKSKETKFVFLEHRREYLLSRLLVRTVLSQYAPIQPHEWIFCRTTYGRPYILSPQLSLPLFFSLSHTEGCMVCAVSRSASIGVDIEFTEKKIQFFELLDQVLSIAEIQVVKKLPLHRKCGRFFQYWTLKESYTKAIGMGLSIPFPQLTFHFPIDFENPESAQIEFDPRISDHSKKWNFKMFNPRKHYQVSLAIKTNPDSQIKTQTKDFLKDIYYLSLSSRYSTYQPS